MWQENQGQEVHVNVQFEQHTQDKGFMGVIKEKIGNFGDGISNGLNKINIFARDPKEEEKERLREAHED